MAGINRYVEAFKENHNLVGLATAVAASAALLNPLPLIGAIVAEAAYLLFVPDSKWYQDRLSSRYDNEVYERRKKLIDQVFPTLDSSVQARFERLERVREQINGQTPDGKHWYREVLRKLDYLMEKFLLFANKEVQFDQYLHSVQEEVGRLVPPPVADDSPIRDSRAGKKGTWSPPARNRQIPDDESDAEAEVSTPMPSSVPYEDAWIRQTVSRIKDAYRREIEGIDTMLQQDDNLHNQAVLEKRKEVLTRREEYVGKIGETLTNLRHQLQLIEDTFGLINDEIRARSPEQVLADIEDVVYQTDTLTEALQDVSPFDTSPAPAGADRLYNVREEKL